MNKLSARIVLCIVWLLAGSAGTYYLSRYAHTPGTAGSTPEHWPSKTTAAMDATRPTLVLFAHPKCPCSRASIGELNRLLTRCEGRLTAHVFFLKPQGVTDDWAQTTLWRDAAAIPGVVVHEDRGGEEAKRFGAETSGSVVLYDTQGNLTFHGGITSERGHSGDNAGSDAIVALLSGKNPGVKQTPTYGCALIDLCARELGTLTSN